MVSLGCPKNLIDSEIMLGLLRKMGIGQARAAQDADVIIVNTCGFIESAKKESIDAILAVARYKQEGVCRSLIVAGCLAQRYRSDIAKELPEVDAFMGPDECGKVGEIVADAWGRVAAKKTYPLLPEQPFQHIAQQGRPTYLPDHETPRLQLTPKHYAYVKISEGCDNPCKFCIIPRLRGAFRSRLIESIVEETKKLVANGVREIILIAQDLTDYGTDIYGERRLATLLEELNAVQGLRWIRLLYAYPAHMTDDLIVAIGKLEKVCKYLDMPVQHLTDAMLLGMGRRLGAQQTIALIARMREKIPGLTLRTSLIVGMPGETDELFEELLRHVETIRFEHLGVFTYSREEGTAAHNMKAQVPEAVKKKRRARVMAAQQKISMRRNTARVGQEIDVIVDGQSSDCVGFIARTEGDCPGIDNTVRVSGEGIEVGELLRVKITHAAPYDLEAVAIVPVLC